MAEFGFKFYDESGNSDWDKSVIMSRVIGYYDIPRIKITEGGNSQYGIIWTHTITDDALATGTPYLFCIPNIIDTNMENHWENYFPPDVEILGNSIKLSYYHMMSIFPDDIRSPLYIGGLRVAYGVYTA